MLAGVLLLAACSSSDRAQDGAPLAGSGGRIASSSAGAAAVAGNAGVGVAGTAAAGAGDPAPIGGVGGGAATGGAAGIGGVGGGAAAGGAAGAAGAAGSAGTAGSAGSAGNGDPCAGLASDCFPICEGGSCQCECPALSCLVARDFTTCCGQYRAVSETELQQDECLVRYPGLYDEVRAGCLARSPIDCAVVQCGLPQPAPSRVAVADGTGGCRFGDECEDGDDCVLAVYSAGCCDCGNSLPRALVEADACYATALEPVSFPPACPRCLSGMPCGACAPPQEPTCLVNDDAANVCR